ncbi:K02A2.6-like [Cordylochernes scorpioides]|uniref:RNA-directed DNA polymerase n=1 Tax=Cordylochernes scorpioides TaxID=51811 RepID=A0ABY6KL15_9ARAC|nr:K02A2.6-like [Cordylochernes scorpioides]
MEIEGFVEYHGRTSYEEFYIVPEEYDALLGRVRHLNINLHDGESQIHETNIKIESKQVNVEDRLTSTLIGCMASEGMRVTLKIIKIYKRLCVSVQWLGCNRRGVVLWLLLAVVWAEKRTEYYLMDRGGGPRNARLAVVTWTTTWRRQDSLESRVSSCDLLEDPLDIEDVLQFVRPAKVIHVNRMEMARVTFRCKKALRLKTKLLKSRRTRRSPKSPQMIWPGTKWCGTGTISTDYEDLGKYREEDKCCRAHDNCNILLKAGESNYNLTNASKYTNHIHVKCNSTCVRSVVMKSNREFENRAAIIVALRAGRSPKEMVDFLKLPKTTIYRVKKQFDEADSNKEGIDTRKKHSRRSDRSYALRKGQLLTENMKNNRKGKAAALLNNLKHDSFGMLRFYSDEKNFDVDQKVNPRNDRWICKDPSEIPVVMHTKFPASVMVLGVISSEGDVMPPHFFEKGLRMNADTYINVLETVVKPWMDMVAAGRKLHCKCDEAFMTCLRQLNTLTSNTLGDFYFNLVRNRCFDLEYPIRGCLRWESPSELALHGNVAENWRRFKQRLMLHLEATEKATKPDKLKVAILLNFIGEEALEVFNTFHLKEDEAENFDLVINKFDDFCEPKKNVIFERFKFFSATQKDGESIDSFITELKGLSTSCEFESQKDSLIRDRIVYGIQDKALQERLLREPNLTLLKAIEMCKTDEISKQQIKIMQNNQNICQIRKYEKKHSPKQNQESEKEFKCQRCGKSHRAKNCPAWGKRCSKCKKMNHFAAFCKSSAIRSLNDETEETVWSIHEAKVVHTLEWKKSIIVNGKEICFKLDSGAEVNVLPYTFTRQMKGLEIFQTNRKLTSYTGHEIKIKGIATLNCKTKNKTESLEFFIADGYYQPILGIEAIEKLSLIKKCDAVQTEQNNSAKEILNRHKNIFEGIGRLPIEHKIRLKENATPVIAPSRKIPFSIREKVKAELERMEKLDIIEKVEEPSEWTHPIVVVQKPSGDVRICMDPRELNKYVQRERYILPTAETIFSELKGATVFSVFDASSAFWQVPLDKESTNLCTIATPFGRFRFKRLPYGLNSASEVFQRCINNILSGLQGTACYMDDILIYGNTMEEHNRNLETVLRRLEENNVKLNAKKQQIAVNKVNFLGHIISRDGIAIQASRAEAIQKLKRPENKTEVQRFLGMYYIWGNDVIVETDHKPLLSIVKKPLEKLSPRLQRMVLRLMRFQISLKFTPGKNMFVADHLSRDPLKDEVDTSYLEGQTESVHMLLVTTDEKIKRLQKETHGDHTLIQLIEYAKNGWPKYKTMVCDEAKPYWQFQDEIHVSDGIVYKGNCIMVPSTLRKEILQVVHSSHQGIAASKEKARSAFYWPGMITQVENEVEKCRTCQEYSRKNPEESRIAHEIPEFPWEKIAVDFMEKYEFKHQTSSPKYPRSNGQVERTIQTIKGLIIKAVKSGRDPNLALMEFNNTPKYDLPSPTQMLMGRSVRTLSTYTRQQLKPLFDTTKNYQKLRDHQQKYAGSPKRILRPLEVGDNIMLQERHRKWVPATVTAKHETPRSYMVKTPSGSEYRRNRSHLRPRKFSVEDSAPTSQSPSIPGSQAGTAMDDNIQDHGRPTSENRRAYDPREDIAKKGEESSTSPSVRTRSGRTVRKPLRYRV